MNMEGYYMEFQDGKRISCFYSGIEFVPLTQAGFTMLSFDQGNPTLKSDDPGQTSLLSVWGMNRYKGGMSPDELYEHMNYLWENYDLDAAYVAYESYDEGEDVEVTKASRLHAQNTFARKSIDKMRST